MSKMKSEEMFTREGFRRIFDALNKKFGYSLKYDIQDAGVVMEGDKARVRLRADVAASGGDVGKLRRALGV